MFTYEIRPSLTSLAAFRSRPAKPGSAKRLTTLTCAIHRARRSVVRHVLPVAPRAQLGLPAPPQEREGTSPSAQLVVERVALHGNAACVLDEPYELVDLLLGAARRAGRLEDLLAHDRALYVVRAEVQGDLRHRHAHHDPVGLHIRNVVEHE